MLKKSLYWTPHKILSHNAMFNMTIGGRGTGKTYGALNYCIKKYIKSGRMFIYLRRYETDLKKKDRLLSTVSQEFPGHEFVVEGEKLQVRRRKTNDEDKPRPWDIMGYVMPLSKASSDKSIPFDMFDTIIYDEFLISAGMQHYIKNEVEAFLDFYNTVDRFNDRVRVLFLANSTNIVNPYFRYFKVNIRKAGKIRTYHNGYVAVQKLKSKQFEDAVTATRFGQMIANTDYYDYAVGNEFRDDTTNFIAKKTSSATFHSAYSFDNQVFSLWQDIASGLYFVSEKVPKDKTPFALTKSDMQPNMVMIQRNSKLLKGVQRLYGMGCVFFESVEVRALFYDVLEYLNLR